MHMYDASVASTLARAIVRRRKWVALAWLGACALLLPFASRVEGVLDVAARVEGSESAAVEHALLERFASPFARYAVLVATGIPSPVEPEGRAALEDIVAVLQKTAGVSRTFSYLDTPDTLFAGAGSSGTFLIVGLDASVRAPDALIPPLRLAMRQAEASLADGYPRIALRLTGEIALNHDLRRTSAADAGAAETRALPLTLILLFLAFGALVAALLPVGSALLAIGLTLGCAALLARHWPLSILLQNVVSMLGLGLGIDYALLMVSRFREFRATGLSAEDSAVCAARRAGPIIALSGAAVAIGFGALLAVPLSELRAIAVGGLLIVGSSVLVAVTLLPGVLTWLGPLVEWGRPRRRSTATMNGARWRRWGAFVTAHPLRVLAISATPVILLALEARRVSTELPRGDWLPPTMESSIALANLGEMQRARVVQGIRILVEFPAGTTALDDAGWRATLRLHKALAAHPQVSRVRSLPAIAASGGGLSRNAQLALVPEHVRSSFVSRDQSAALLEVIPHEPADAARLGALVRQLRSAGAGTLTGLSGARLLVGGLPAFNVDYQDGVGQGFWLVLLLVVGSTFIALAVGFRSVLIALKAVALNLLSVAAAFGALVLVFQEGHGASLVGVSEGTGGIFPAIPLLVFCTVFGLSMDYEVFLVARVREARMQGLGEDDAVAEGLARSGGMITSAAAIMIVVFAAFMLGEFLLIRMLGFALAVAVFLDATVVRMAIGPALLALAGKWNWWPGRVPPLRYMRSLSDTSGPGARHDRRRPTHPERTSRPIPDRA